MMDIMSNGYQYANILKFNSGNIFKSFICLIGNKTCSILGSGNLEAVFYRFNP